MKLNGETVRFFKDQDHEWLLAQLRQTPFSQTEFDLLRACERVVSAAGAVKPLSPISSRPSVPFFAKPLLLESDETASNSLTENPEKNGMAAR